MTRETHDALNLAYAVRLRILRESAPIIFDPVAKVDTPREFADDVEVHALGDMFLERGELEERVGCEVAGAQVAECLQFFAEEEKALFRTDGASAPFRTADGAEEDGICGFGSGEGFVGEGNTVGVD
jgi:hypothetical protein